jgi:hypothetical protein
LFGFDGLAVFSGTLERLRSLDTLKPPGIMSRFPEIGLLLQVEPELRRIAKNAGKHQRSIGGYRSLVSAKLVHEPWRHTHYLSQPGLAEAEWLQKLMSQDFTDRGGFAINIEHDAHL